MRSRPCHNAFAAPDIVAVNTSITQDHFEDPYVTAFRAAFYAGHLTTLAFSELVACLHKQCFFLSWQRKIESAHSKKAIGRCDSHHFQNVTMPGQIHTLLDKCPANSFSLMVLMNRKTANLGKFGRIDFQCGETNYSIIGLGNESKGNQITQFVKGARQQPICRYKVIDQLLELRNVVATRGSNPEARFIGAGIIGFSH
jgi:hypothetical protein